MKEDELIFGSLGDDCGAIYSSYQGGYSYGGYAETGRYGSSAGAATPRASTLPPYYCYYLPPGGHPEFAPGEDESAMALVASRFKEDIERFGYSLPRIDDRNACES